MTAGRHQYSYVVDGKSWSSDPNAPSAPDDGFGHANSVKIVRERINFVTFARGLASRVGFRTTHVAAALALAVAAPTLLRAQSAEPDRIARLDVGSSYAITLLIDSANTEGLPGRMLRLKAYEGIAKKGRRHVRSSRPCAAS